MRTRTAIIGVATLGVALFSPAAAQAATGHHTGAQSKRISPAASVYVVQGLPGSTVTVGMDGSAAKHDLKSGAVAGPWKLASGKHVVTFSGTHPTWTMKASLDISSAASLDVVLHRPASVSGKPVVTVYTNPLKPLAAGKGRVVVAHTAVVPPADVLVDKKVVFRNIANGEFAVADVPAGIHHVSIVPTGEKSPTLLGPVPLDVKAGELTRVFAVGRPQDGSMNVIVQRLKLATTGSRTPTHLETGSAGLVAGWTVHTTSGSSGSTVSGQDALARDLAGGSAGLLLLAAGAWLLRRRQMHIDAGL